MSSQRWFAAHPTLRIRAMPDDFDPWPNATHSPDSPEIVALASLVSPTGFLVWRHLATIATDEDALVDMIALAITIGVPKWGNNSPIVRSLTRVCHQRLITIDGEVALVRTRVNAPHIPKMTYQINDTWARYRERTPRP